MTVNARHLIIPHVILLMTSTTETSFPFGLVFLLFSIQTGRGALPQGVTFSQAEDHGQVSRRKNTRGQCTSWDGTVLKQ